MNSVHLKSLIAQAIGGDILHETNGGFVAVMAHKGVDILNDIPAAFELYALLDHFIDLFPLQMSSFLEGWVQMTLAVHYDAAQQRVLCMVPIAQGELEHVAHWISGRLYSDRVRGMPGMLALPFVIERHDGVDHLIPEWFAAFYVDGNPDHCVPLLTLMSATLDPRLNDWVRMAILRMPLYGMPCVAAQTAASGFMEPAAGAQTNPQFNH